MNIIQNYVLISGDCIEIVTALPAPGTMSNDAILEQFVEDLRDNTQGLSPLAKVICLNGPATGTMMAVLGAWAVRFGAKALEVFDPRQLSVSSNGSTWVKLSCECLRHHWL